MQKMRKGRLVPDLFLFFTALKIRAGQRSITANLWSLTANTYHVMIIVTGGFSEKSFLLLLPSNSFEQS